MSYQVIARKYRPQRFSDVVGQEHVTRTLSNAITQSRIAHAYLFCGPRGTGKTTIARIFAKCLNCTDGPKVDFSDDDPRCIEITQGRALDVMEIDGASNNGVEQVRELRETCKYAPASSRYKIYIIDEVHMLSSAAFNALLKTLEEPPEHVKFMFATTEPEKVLPTILSRCQRFDLRRIPSALIVEHLASIAKKEKVKIDEPALFAIARGADGGMRDAESTLDQLISFCGDTINEPDVLSMFGLTSQGQILDLSRAILSGDSQAVLRHLNELAQHGKDLARLLADLLSHFRNLLIFKISKGDRSLIEVSEVEAAMLNDQVKACEADSVTRIMEVLTECETRLRDAASKRIFLEVGLLRAIEASRAVNLDTVLEKLQSLRSEGGTTQMNSTAVPATTPKPARPPAKAPASNQSLHESPPEPVPAKTPKSAAPDTDNSSSLNNLWAQLVESVGRASPFVRTYLLEAHPVSLEGNVLTIGFDPEFADHLGLVDNTRNHAILQTKLQELGHPGCQLKFIKSDRPVGYEFATATIPESAPSAPQNESAPAAKPQPVPPPAPSGPVTLDKEDFKSDPLIKKALEIFKGQIVDVRA